MDIQKKACCSTWSDVPEEYMIIQDDFHRCGSLRTAAFSSLHSLKSPLVPGFRLSGPAKARGKGNMSIMRNDA